MPAPQPYVTAYSNQTVAQVLLLYLGREGVTTIFGVPGGGVANLLVELKDQRQRFEYVVCRHETGAAYIADGYYRAAGILGVVVVTSGSGATNALTGAMTAQNDGSGLLVISGEVSQQYFSKGYLQEGVCLIFLDAGNCIGWGIHYFTIDRPREIHSALAMGPMGFAVGAVIGAKIGRPERTCVALVGRTVPHPGRPADHAARS
jgi:thiamine pyrophosphate-dependent acetolactate synthase large subunit-like protein